MRKLKAYQLLMLLVVFALAASFASASAGGELMANYSYTLANFLGPVKYHWPILDIDRENNEVYVLNQGREIRIFGDHGMEIYRFGEDGSLGGVIDIAVVDGGDLYVLSRRRTAEGFELVVLRCNYRGEPVKAINWNGLPPEFSHFKPNRMVYRNGLIYLADTYAMKVVALDSEGTFQRGHDIRALIEKRGLKEEDVKDTDMAGFDVDPKGNVLFTVSSLFAAYRVSPDGEIDGFGGRGSTPGKFGVVAGIRADDYGYYYVTDRLRCVVIVYDSSLTFRTEFGYRGPRPGNLIVPNDLAVGNGRVYVSQSGDRGVSVFRLYQESAGHKEFLGERPEKRG